MTAYIQLPQKDLDRFYSFAQITKQTVFNLTADYYDNALFRKGLQLNIKAQIENLAASDSTATHLIEVLKSYRRRLAKEYAKQIAQRQNTEDLETKANAIEKELAHTVAGFGEATHQLRWQEVQTALRPGEAAIEFIHYRYYNPEPTDSIMYAALFQRYGDSIPHVVPLFEAQQLATLLPQSNDLERIDEFYKMPTGETIYSLIWQPLDTLLEGIKTVYCSPSGLLYRINLGAIPANATYTFADKHALISLGSTRQLPNREHAAVANSSGALLFGGIQYDSCASIQFPLLPLPNRGLEPTVPDEPAFGGPRRWKFLPATLNEVENIATILQGKYPYRGQNGYCCHRRSI